MLPWQIWLIISGVCFIAEIATVGFLVFWFGVAALITCLLSLFISNVIAQTVIFVILSVILICLTRPFAEKMNKNDNIVTNSNAIIGKEGVVTKNITPNDVGQVKVSGDIWTAISTYTDIIPLIEYNKVSFGEGGRMRMKYLSTFEAAEKWGISHRRVSVLCNEGRITGAQRAGSRWIIPENAEKPSDARIRSGKYIKKPTEERGT